MKKILALLLTIVMIFSVASCKNEEKPENTTAPEVTTTPPANDDTPNYEVEIPTASELLAGVIGALSANLEVSKDTELVYVYESKDGSSESYTQVIFVEVAEATVNSDSETLQAQLTLKLGMARATGANAVVDKTNAEYGEISVIVDGEDISISVDGEKTTANLSEVLYGAVLQMMGMSDMAELEALLQSAFIAQELETNLLLILEKALTSAELPAITPAYSEHIQALFGTLVEDIITESTDAAGNTTYSLDLTALKAIVTDIKDKTFVEYIGDVYGTKVANEFVSNFENLPNKTVKEIVDAAVALAEAADVEIKEIYALIDLYIETVTGAKFDIEAQIKDRYNKTLVELLVEFSGVPAESQREFIDNVKLSFAQVAQMLKTASFDEALSSLFMEGADESFFDTVDAGIDALNSIITFNYTENATGELVALNCTVSDFQLTVEAQGDDTVINVAIPGGKAITATVGKNSFSFAATENDKQVASGSFTVTQATEGDVTFTTIQADLHDAENDLLDFTVTLQNGAVTGFDMIIRGYDVSYNEYYDGEKDEWIKTENKTFTTFVEVEYNSDGEGKTLSFASDDVVVTFLQEAGQLGVIVTENEEVVAEAIFTFTVTTEGDAQVLTVGIDVDYFETANNEYEKSYATFKSAISFKIS